MDLDFVWQVKIDVGKMDSYGIDNDPNFDFIVLLTSTMAMKSGGESWPSVFLYICDDLDTNLKKLLKDWSVCFSYIYIKI